MFFSISQQDDIGDTINEAKSKVVAANNGAGKTMDKVNDIKKKLNTINVTRLDSNLSSIMDDVDKSGEGTRDFGDDVLQTS